MVYVERKVAALLQQRLGPVPASARKGLLQPLADIIKLMFKEELRPAAADPLLFALAPIISATAAFAAFAVVPFGAETTFFGLLDEPLRLQVADVNVAVLVDLRDRVDERLRHRARRLELEQQVLAARRAALVGADDQLRAVVRPGARRRAADRPTRCRSPTSSTAQAGTWFGFIPRWFVFLQPVGFLDLHDRGHRRDQPRAVRFSRSGAGAGRRLPHRVQQHELRDVLPRGVHQHGHGVGGGDRSVPRRLARAVPAGVARLDLVPAQGRRRFCSSTSGCGGRCRAIATTS